MALQATIHPFLGSTSTWRTNSSTFVLGMILPTPRWSFPRPLQETKTENWPKPSPFLLFLYSSSATNRLIGAKDHASVQINIGDVDETGRYTGSFTTYALSGYVRAQSEADDSINRLATKDGCTYFFWTWSFSVSFDWPWLRMTKKLTLSFAFSSNSVVHGLELPEVNYGSHSRVLSFYLIKERKMKMAPSMP